MEAKELRLGNYIQGYHSPYAMTKVDRIILSRVDDDGEIEGEAIPLTAELIERCGFLKSRDGYTRCWWIGHNPITSDFLMVIKQNDAGKFFYQNTFHELKYLHQLQNLYFALAGWELEIKL